MENKIKQILSDLYALDPQLQEREAELVQLLSRLLVSRPDTRFDRRFAKRLRRELVDGPVAEQSNSITNYLTYMTETFTMRQLSYAGVGVAAVVLVAVVWSATLGPATQQLAFSNGITDVDARAFGALKGDGSQSERSASAAGLGGGAGNPVSSVVADASREEAAIAQADMGGDGDAKMGIMPVPEMNSYRFVYDGELSLADTELPVLRRVKSLAAARALAGQFTNINLDSVNLQAFSDLALQNISFVEDRDLGYSVNINIEEGMLSISENWKRWRDLEMENCRDEACYQALRLKEGDIPSDEALIAMADAFIAQYGIDMSQYGAPQVNKDWRNGWETRSVADRWIPDVMDVVYPLQIDGQTVYEEGGTVFGVHVNVNVRKNRVSGLWNYTTHNYERSMYPAETDTARIKKIVEQGGRYMPWWPENQKQVDVALGEPERVLVKVWRYNGGDGEEFIVPALKFPILDKPENSYIWQNFVIVPLISEILDEYEVQPGGPIIMPVEPFDAPATEPAAGEDTPVTDVKPEEEETALPEDEATIEILR